MFLLLEMVLSAADAPCPGKQAADLAAEGGLDGECQRAAGEEVGAAGEEAEGSRRCRLRRLQQKAGEL